MIAASDSLARLRAALAALDERDLDRRRIAELLAACDLSADAAAPPLGAGRYTRHAIARSRTLEIIIVRWPAGSASPVHDHGGSRCFVKVLRGAIEVSDFRLVAGSVASGDTRLEPARAAVLGPAALDIRGGRRDIHRVRAVGGPARTLHVYVPPVDRCTVFDLTANRCRQAELRYDTPPPDDDEQIAVHGG